MAFDSLNNLYIVNLNAGTVLQYSPTGTLITSTFISGLTYLLGIAIDAYGYIYVSRQLLNASNIYKYSSTGVLLSTLTSGLNYATQMCIVNGDLYTAISTGNDANVSGGASYTGGTVSKITLYSFTMSSTPPLFIASGLASPYGLVTDTNGCVYVLNQYASSSNGIGLVIQYYPDGTVRNPLFVPPPATPISYCGIAIDVSNNIYVTDIDKNKVYQFIVNASGNITTYNYNFITTGLSAPQGCVFDNSGNFYVSNAYGFINKYVMSNGVIQTTFLNFVTGTGNTWQMAFDSANNMYIATSTGYGIIYKAPPSSGASTTPTSFANIGSIYGSVIGVALDSNGNIYASGNAANSAIIKFPSTGGTYPSAGTIIYSGRYITQLWIKNNYLYFPMFNDVNTNTGSISKMPINMSSNNTIMTYGNGTFVMLYQNYLGTNGPLMYSTDISNNVWKYTTPIIPDGTFYRGVAYGNGMFVCVNQTNTNVLLSGSQLVNIPSAQSNVTYGNVYINKLLNIRAYNDGLGAPYSGNLGLISKDSSSLTFNWALVRNATTNGLLFQSSYGYQFYTNCTSSLSGTIALTVSSTGNVGVGSSATNPQYALDMTGAGGVLFKSTKIVAGNTYALSVSDNISSSLLNNSYATVNFTNSSYTVYPNNNFISLVNAGLTVCYLGYIFNGTVPTQKLGFYPAWSDTPCVSFLSLYQTVDLISYYPFDVNYYNYASGTGVNDIRFKNGEPTYLSIQSSSYIVGSGALKNLGYNYSANLYIGNIIIPSSGGISISCWFNFANIATNQGYGVFRFCDENYKWYFSFCLVGNTQYGGKPGAYLNYNNTYYFNSNITFSNSLKNGWHHLVWTLSYAPEFSFNSRWNIYIDNVNVFTANNGLYPTNQTFTLNCLSMEFTGTEYSSIYLDDFRVYNNVLNSSNVSQLYSLRQSNLLTLYTNNIINRVGINTTSPLFELDVNGTGRFTQNVQSNNLTCNSLSVTTPRRWFITNSAGSDYFTSPGYILGSSGSGGGGFNIVWYNDATGTGNTDFDTSTGKFTAPENGLYLFQLNVFNNASGNVGRLLAISGTGVPYQYTSNVGKYETFNQSQTSDSNESSYTMTDIFYLKTGQTVYYYVPTTPDNANSTRFFHFYGHTNLKIFKIR